MLLKLFKGNGPGVIFLIAVICIAVWIADSSIHPLLPMQVLSQEPMPLFELLTKVTGKDAHVQVTVAFIMVAVMAFLLVNFNTTKFFYK